MQMQNEVELFWGDGRDLPDEVVRQHNTNKDHALDVRALLHISLTELAMQVPAMEPHERARFGAILHRNPFSKGALFEVDFYRPRQGFHQPVRGLMLERIIPARGISFGGILQAIRPLVFASGPPQTWDSDHFIRLLSVYAWQSEEDGLYRPERSEEVREWERWAAEFLAGEEGEREGEREEEDWVKNGKKREWVLSF